MKQNREQPTVSARTLVAFNNTSGAGGLEDWKIERLEDWKIEKLKSLGGK